VVAEGVETEAHARKLVEFGCAVGQGFGIARPMPAGELWQWWATRRGIATA
jgi:EAL domain-containing protein (putative c-di-GMP-specific phosphodiesterase class I)